METPGQKRSKGKGEVLAEGGEFRGDKRNVGGEGSIRESV